MLSTFKKRLGACAGVLAALAAATLLSSCTSTKMPSAVTPGDAGLPAVPPVQHITGEVPPPAPREFRAAWVSTVANIDWPSRSNLPVAKQQAEALAILDRAKSLNLNAIVLAGAAQRRHDLPIAAGTVVGIPDRQARPAAVAHV